MMIASYGRPPDRQQPRRIRNRLVAICASALLANCAFAAPGTAVEYFHATLGHYFVTAFPDEIAVLDAGTTTKGWTTTGYAFSVAGDASGGELPVCRFFSVTFAPKSSHFYTPYEAECASLKAGSTWTYEGIAFYLKLPSASGACEAEATSIYRLYNNGVTGRPIIAMPRYGPFSKQCRPRAGPPKAVESPESSRADRLLQRAARRSSRWPHRSRGGMPMTSRLTCPRATIPTPTPSRSSTPWMLSTGFNTCCPNATGRGEGNPRGDLRHGPAPKRFHHAGRNRLPRILDQGPHPLYRSELSCRPAKACSERTFPGGKFPHPRVEAPSKKWSFAHYWSSEGSFFVQSGIVYIEERERCSTWLADRHFPSR
jgi:Repeat of unknown function (DUF5648)